MSSPHRHAKQTRELHARKKIGHFYTVSSSLIFRTSLQTIDQTIAGAGTQDLDNIIIMS